MVLVSVIIPCYNVEDFIEECLESVFNQSHSNLEVICVNNNSTDKTLFKLKALKTIYPSLIVLEENKKGASAARNTGLFIAKGEWIQFLDADDLLISNKISHQLELLKLRQDIAYVAGAYTRQDHLGANKGDAYPLEEDFKMAAFINRSGCTCSNLWSKKWLLNVNGWNDALLSSQETDLMLRITYKGGVVFPDFEPLTIIRERKSGQISQSDPAKRWKRFIETRIPFYKQELRISDTPNNNISTLKSYLLSSILILQKYDQNGAEVFFKQLLKDKLDLKPSKYVSATTLMILRIFGIRGFGMLKRLKRIILPVTG